MDAHWSHHVPSGTKPSEHHAKVRQEVGVEWNKRFVAEHRATKDEMGKKAVYNKHMGWLKAAEKKHAQDPTKSVAQHYADQHIKEQERIKREQQAKRKGRSVPSPTNPNNASTVYNQRPWGMPAPTVENQALGPDQSNSERIVGNKLQAALLAQSVPPPVRLFRPRFGYRMDAYELRDILNVDLVFSPPNPGAWYSGGPAETNSSSTYSNYSATFGNL